MALGQAGNRDFAPKRRVKPIAKRRSTPQPRKPPSPVRVVEAVARSQRPAPAPKATPTQLRSGRAQQAAYVSQGRAVKQVAHEQRVARHEAEHVARVRAHREKKTAQTGYVSQGKAVEKAARTANQRTAAFPYLTQAADVAAKAHALDTAQALREKHPKADIKTIGDQLYAKSRRPILKDYWSPITAKGQPDIKKAREVSEARAAVTAAPALKVLDQTTRLQHGIAAGTKAAIEGKDVGHAAKRGVQLKDRTNFGDVLKSAGVKNKAVQGAVGFALDVAADPTTYVTFGAGSVARKAAAKAAADTAKKAATAGLSEAGTATVTKQAAKRAVATAPAGKGVTVKFAGKEVPGVRRGTAAVARGVRAPVRKAAPTLSKTVPAKVRRTVREFAPRTRQAGVSEETHAAARQAARKATATVKTAESRLTRFTQDLKRRLPDEDFAKVADAVDRNDFRGLTPELAAHAHRLRSEFKGARRVSKRAGRAAETEPDNFLRGGDLRKLDTSITAEKAATKESVKVARRAETKAANKTAVQAGQRLERTQAELRAELAKPVTERQGVPALAVKVAELRRRVQAPTPGPAVREAGARETKAAAKHTDAAAETQRQQARRQAAKNIPQRGRGRGVSLGETHAQYLARLRAYAHDHDLPLVAQRAETLLDKKPTDVAAGYFPRDFEPRILQKLGLTDEQAAAGAGRGGRGGQARTISPTTAGFTRTDPRALRTVNPERVAAGAEPFSTNVPLIAANHLREAARATSQGEFAKNMAKLGRPIKDVSELQPGEHVFKLGYKSGKFGLHPVRGVPGKATKGGQYVALDRQMLEDLQKAVERTGERTAAGAALDKVTGGWKRVALATFGYHVRNLIGDTWTAYTLPGAGGSLPKTLSAGKAVRRASEQARTLTPAKTDATIKVAGRQQPIDEFLKGARENGVLDTGYLGGELKQLTGETGKAGKVKGPGRTRGGRAAKRGGRAVGRWMTNRENLMRVASYKHALDRGMSPGDAADVANRFHIDYGDLSQTERVFLRRLFPFYTWTARTLPLTVSTLATHPGKYATLEKAREETEHATGLDEQSVRHGLREAVARQIPFVVKVGDAAHGFSASIPPTLLNELPAGASGKDLDNYLSELGRFTFQMIHPVAKGLIEQRTGRNVYTQQDIESSKHPLVAAPSWVKHLPDEVKRKLDVTPDYIDKRTGKKMWGWRGQADWWLRQAPGAPQQVSTIASGGRPGAPEGPGSVAAGVAGIRVDALTKQAVEDAGKIKLRDKRAKLERRAAVLNQQGITSANATPEYKRLRQQINALEKQITPPKTTARKKAARPAGLRGGGGRPLGLRSTGSRPPGLVGG